MAIDFARLLWRICSTVNPRPQTLHRQLGEGSAAIPGTCCVSGRLALTNSLLHSGHCRCIIGHLHCGVCSEPNQCAFGWMECVSSAVSREGSQ